MPPYKVTPRAQSKAHTVRPTPPKERVEVPHHHKVLAGLPAYAAICDTSTPTVRHWIAQGMPVIRGGAAGGRLLIPVRLAQEWLESRAVSLAPGAEDVGDDEEEPMPNSTLDPAIQPRPHQVASKLDEDSKGRTDTKVASAIRKSHGSPCGKLPQGGEGKTRDKAGKAVGVSEPATEGAC